MLGGYNILRDMAKWPNARSHSGTPINVPKFKWRTGPKAEPRPAETYRGARRNLRRELRAQQLWIKRRIMLRRNITKM